jgi:proline iminopeptidase
MGASFARTKMACRVRLDPLFAAAHVY